MTQATYSSSWKASAKPRKQRSYHANAPLHKKRKLLSAHLTKSLQQQHGEQLFR